MIRAIVGAGPRVGSSWVMAQLHKAGLPVHWDEEFSQLFPVGGNPGGYYETNANNLPMLNNVICKVWPLGSATADIERMVVLSRDPASQLKSIEAQMEREAHILEAVGLDDWTPEDFLVKSQEALRPLLSIPHMRVRTEDLNDRIDDIINYMRY